MKAVKAQARLFKRGGTFYYRQKIPSELSVRYGRRREVKESLKTGDLRIAKHLAHEKSVQWNREFEQVKLAGLQLIPTEAIGTFPWHHQVFINARESGRLFEVQEIDENFITKVCRTYLRTRLSEDSEWRAAKDFDGKFYASMSANFRLPEVAKLKRMLRDGDVEPVRETLTEFLERLGYRITGEPKGYRTLLLRFLEALISEEEALESRDGGNPVDVEKLAPLEHTLLGEVEMPGITVENLFENWRSEGTRKPKTIDEYAAIAREFQNYLRSRFKITQAIQVKKSHVIAYRKHLKESGRHSKTIGKRISTLRTIFRKAVDDELLVIDPTHLVKVQQDHSPAKARLPFSTEELRKIFTSGCHAARKRPEPDEEDAGFWVPLIGVFSGMRIEEICQLRVSDFDEDKTHGWYLMVQDGEGQSIKTATSRRQVPIHPDLKRIGLIKFVQRQRERKEEWLFAELSVDAYGRRSSAFSKRWNRATRKLLGAAAEKRKKVFHSFRHVFKHWARYCDISEDVHDALTGHAGDATEGRSYGAELYPLPRLVNAMKMYRVPDLDLSHLYPAEK